jgi:hypothetical protein
MSKTSDKSLNQWPYASFTYEKEASTVMVINSTNIMMTKRAIPSRLN